MITLLKRVAVCIVILVILGLIGRTRPDPPKHKPSAPKTREEAVQRLSAETGYSREEIRRAINRFERNR